MGAYCKKKYQHSIFITHFTHKQPFGIVIFQRFSPNPFSSQVVQAFVDNPALTEYKCPPDLTGYDRKMLHQLAEQFNLGHLSHGRGRDRALVLSKDTLFYEHGIPTTFLITYHIFDSKPRKMDCRTTWLGPPPRCTPGHTKDTLFTNVFFIISNPPLFFVQNVIPNPLQVAWCLLTNVLTN